MADANSTATDSIQYLAAIIGWPAYGTDASLHEHRHGELTGSRHAWCRLGKLPRHDHRWWRFWATGSVAETSRPSGRSRTTTCRYTNSAIGTFSYFTAVCHAADKTASDWPITGPIGTTMGT